MVEYLKLLNSYSERNAVTTIYSDHNENKSYAELYKDIKVYAQKLEDVLGDVEGKHIGILSSNSYEFTALLIAIIASRAVAVPLNIHESLDNLDFLIRNAELDMLVFENSDRIDKLNLSIIAKPISFFDEGERVEKELKDFNDNDADTDALIIHTSGTTGVAKGVVTSIGNLFGVPRFYLAELFRINENDKTSHSGYINLPFYHIAGIMAFLAVTQIGQTMCFSKDYRRIAKDVETNDIDVAVVPPAVLKLWEKMLRRGRREKLGGTKFIYVAGAALNLDTVKLFLQNRIGIIQTYGMTETGGDVAMNWEMDKHPDSVGKIPSGVVVKIVDGEILVKSWSNMKGYYNNSEETDKILKDGFIHTGDLGYIDDEGYLYIIGRKKNLIILSGGENVSPEELEKELYKNALIEECVVYEDDDRITAEIYAPKGTPEEIKEYIAMLNTRLPIYKRIYKTVIRESEFEKSALGKIKRS